MFVQSEKLDVTQEDFLQDKYEAEEEILYEILEDYQS